MNLEKLEINSSIPTTKVMQIVNFICTEIQTGKLQAPWQFPSITSFSKEKSISRETVEKAYRKLEQEGYLVCVKGKGTFLPELSD